ncbi:MAG: hypothetical protein KIT31_13845 [Deltaproteobacteria bacterium]|nr:hypothetical protein [Deltaproteobacteria bacterium]
MNIETLVCSTCPAAAAVRVGSALACASCAHAAIDEAVAAHGAAGAPARPARSYEPEDVERDVLREVLRAGGSSSDVAMRSKRAVARVEDALHRLRQRGQVEKGSRRSVRGPWRATAAGAAAAAA